MIASLFYATSLMVFGNTSLKELGFLVKNFWLMLVGFCSSAVIMLLVETPMIPNNVFDIMMSLNHVTSMAVSTFLAVASSKYITAINISIALSFDVPLTLLAQITFLRQYGKDIAGPLQYAGAVIVFVAVLAKPLLKVYANKKREDEP